MKMKYHETQYYHPLFYVGVGGLLLVLVTILMVLVAGGVFSTVIFVLAGVCLLMVMLLAALGRMKVTVNDHSLVVSFGWLKWIRRSFHLHDIDNARVCVLKPLMGYLGWGLSIGFGKSACYTARGGRGVEITSGGRRFVIGSDNPARLKAAVLKCDQLADDQPEYRREDLRNRFPRRRRFRAYKNWGILHPHELRQ